jgi:hypothetical protein
MKKTLLFLIVFASVISYEAIGQTCGRIGLIGEFNDWNGDLFLDRNPENPALFSTIITLDTSSNAAGPGTKDTVFMKFRENAGWDVNWGAYSFPTGIGTQNGSNIPVLIDTVNAATTSYYVTFNCETGAYSFTSVCGKISMIGEMTDWGSDLWMTRDAVNMDLWTMILGLDTASNTGGSTALDTIEMKFRESGGWATNWGGPTFPSGTGVQNGPNIKVPIDTVGGAGKSTFYKVTFNCSTGEYNFESTQGPVSLIGEFNDWNADLFMNRLASNPDMWEVAISLDTSSNAAGINAIDTIELKFRENASWSVNWGGPTFPSGIGVQNGPNIKVPIDTTGGGGKKTDYYVTFNSSTGAYNFVKSWASMAMIGAFNAWNGDIPMNRDASNPNLWKLYRSWYEDSPVKFRADGSWTSNWGSSTFPNGTGVDNGPNIPLTAGKYDVTFNSADLSYSFVVNNSYCGEIGIIGKFNAYGGGVNNIDSIDLFMVRDPLYPSQFSIEHNFTGSDSIWFRLDRDPNYENIWGGTAFPIGIGQQGITSPRIVVPAGKYIITFNCQSFEYTFTRLGNAVIAPKVFTMNIDGTLDEPDWKITQPISQVIDGTPSADLNTAYFGVTYNKDFLYVGINITDAFPTPGDAGEVFIDGDKSGGGYDAHDIHLKFTGFGGVEVIWGPAGIVVPLGFQLTATGYSAEVAIPWAPLGVVPAEGDQVGFDIILWDDDTGAGVQYKMAWNGSLDDYTNTSSFGDLLFGSLSCGCISLYNTSVGDVVLQNPSSSTTSYIGSYELFSNQDLVFRKDTNSAVTWGTDVFPTGVATLGGSAIPAATGRYRVSFDCITGAYNFDNNITWEVAYSEYTDTPPVMDGDLTEYTLSYGSAILVEGVDNNTVTWGSRWDMNNLYIGAHVADATVVPTVGNPWDNDAIEYYIDGNHDRDGAYDKNFDTQLIQDANSNSTYDTVLWTKADGVPIRDFSAKWKTTGDGYSVELRLGWDNFAFLPGQGRSIGFSLGNDDNNGGAVRTGQTVWYGTASDWSNTADLGDLQLKDGPFFFNVGNIVDYSDQIVLYPNPATNTVYLRMVSDIFKGNVTLNVNDITGRTVIHETYNIESNNMILMDASLFRSGIYFVNIIGQNGERATKKLIIR